MLRVLLAGILFISIGCASRSPTSEKKAEHYLKIGTAHLNQGNYPSALNALQNAEKYNPDNPVVQNNLGLAFFVRQHYQDAERHMRKAIKLEPKYTEARNNLGRTLIQLGLYDAAIKELKLASSDLTYTNPQKTYTNLGLAYLKKGALPQALEALKRSLKISKANCLTYNHYARTLFEMKKFKEASLAFDQALELCRNRRFAEPHYYSGLAYYQLGQTEQAVARLKELVKIYPESEQAEKAKSLLKIIR